MTRLIVNADDFGLTSGINRAILELHRDGVLTSASLMARAPATAEAIELARSTPSLGVGCHILLVDGQPALPPAQIPSLVHRRTGRFHSSLAAFLLRLFAGQIRPQEIQAEAAAQIALLQTSGLRLTHIDTHKHTHIFPAVLRPLLRAARAAGIRSVRNPFEPPWAVRATAGAAWSRCVQVSLLRCLQSTSLRIIAEEGFSTTAGAIAMVGTGTLNAPTLRSLLRQLPPGTWELVTHPGYNDAALQQLRTRLRASRDIERRALAVLREFPSLELLNFAGLPPSPPPANL